MMTREEVLEIDAYCQEHKVSYRQRLEELDIRFWNYYKAKKKYRLQDEAAATDGNMSGVSAEVSEKREKILKKNLQKSERNVGGNSSQRDIGKLITSPGGNDVYMPEKEILKSIEFVCTSFCTYIC